MRHPKLILWEKKLQKVLSRIDGEMEEKYGRTYPLHPARAKHGTTSSKKQDGLFAIDAAFTPGHGSELGRGYIVRIRMVTLARVPKKTLMQMEKEVVTKLRRSLPKMFPGKNLKVDKDGHIFKIHGDLSLGDL
jgi:hypothetical protein